MDLVDLLRLLVLPRRSICIPLPITAHKAVLKPYLVEVRPPIVFLQHGCIATFDAPTDKKRKSDKVNQMQ